MSHEKSRLVRICVVLAAILGNLTAQAEPVLIEDFNNGLSGWSPFDATTEQPWGPGIVGTNGKGELVLAGRYPNLRENSSLVGVEWAPEGGVDPLFSEGTLRARVRIEEASTQTGLFMRNAGGLDSGFNNYLFFIGSSVDGSRFCISRLESTESTGSECAFDQFIPYGEDVFLQASAIGNQLSFKVWPADGVEPAEPQVALTDELYTTGTLGMYAVRDGTQGDYSFDSRYEAIYDDLTFTPAEPAASADLVPEPACISWAIWLGAVWGWGRWRRRSNACPAPCRCASDACVSRARPYRYGQPRSKLWATTGGLDVIAAPVPTHAVRSVALLLICFTVTGFAVQESQAQEAFGLGTFVSRSAAPTAIPLAIPEGKYNAYSFATDWSALGVDPWSEEAIWAISSGPLGVETTIYVDAGPAPNHRRDSEPVRLEWSGMLELPLTGPLDAQLWHHQAFQNVSNFDARWANTVLELSYVQPPAPPQIDADLGVIIDSFSSFVIDTRMTDFDTELGIYSETGKLIGRNDDIVSNGAPGLPQSEVEFHLGLPVGDYVAVVGGFNTLFEDNYVVSPGTLGGNYTVSAAGASTMGSLESNQVAYISFSGLFAVIRSIPRSPPAAPTKTSAAR